jgi:cyanophycinase
MLFAVGGAEDQKNNPVCLERFLNAAGGPAAHIAVVTAAAHDTTAAWQRYAAIFRRLGAEATYWADDPSEPDHLADWWPAVSGIWLTGGDQVRLCDRVTGSGLQTRLIDRWHAGAVLGGTSAGAAALSRIMIAGGSARHPRDASRLQMAFGLGFWPHAIIDQHFSQRGRLVRLLAAVLTHPQHMGVGIDEDTAAVVDADGHALTCVGSGAVTVVEGSDTAGTQERQVVTVNFLTAGDRFVPRLAEVTP